MTNLPTVKEVIADCEDMHIKIEGTNPLSDTDPLHYSYYDGFISEIPEGLLGAEVLYAGFSHGSNCPVICVPYGDYTEKESENTEDFSIELISKGSFVEEVNDKQFLITAYVIRLSPEALNKWLFCSVIPDRDCFETYEEYIEDCRLKQCERNELYAKIYGLLGISSDEAVLTRNLSEIFTVTQISRK